MDSTRDLSVGDLLDQLLADSLIDACHITGDFVTIVQGTKRHSFPYRQARTFLFGMLRGRSWNLKGDEADQDHGVPPLRAIEKRREDVSVALEAAADTSLDARDEGSSRGTDSPAPSRKFVRSIGPALDELLAMALDMELIESSSKDDECQTVTIVLSACQTRMQCDEAVIFLTECILYKLNVMRDEVLRLSDDAGRREIAKRAGPREEAPARARAGGDEPVWKPLG